MQRQEIAIIVGIVVLLILVLGLLAGPTMIMAGGPGMMGAFRFNPLFWVSMFLFWALILGAVTLFTVWFARTAGVLTPPRGRSSRALEILNERFARGEISREQYAQMRSEIERR